MFAISKRNKMKKITLTTIKTFVKKNREKLYIKVKSDFNGMTDCVESVNGDFKLVEVTDRNIEQTLGIEGAWFVRGSRDYFNDYSDNVFVGYEVYNSCGSFILAIKK